ncbi:D-glycero-beta-D-manno-heptose 1-phosphate adenylyltransferase [Olivibacter ginsenosidimutans]
MDHPIQQPLQKLLARERLIQQVAEWQQAGEKVVFTNGCFDLLHPGHLNYLLEAAALGQKLVIGLNSDASVKRLKGQNRPINDEMTRASFLACLYFIDAISIFEEDTPLELIKAIKPNILVKGGDYTVNTIVGANEVLARGGTVKTLAFVPGYSTTNLIKKIQEQL